MEKLTKEETDRLETIQGGVGFSNPIRSAFNDLEVGQSIVFTMMEWNEYYKSNHPGTSVAVWAKTKLWKVSTRRVVTPPKDNLKKSNFTYAVIRTV